MAQSAEGRTTIPAAFDLLKGQFDQLRLRQQLGAILLPRERRPKLQRFRFVQLGDRCEANANSIGHCG